MKTRKEKIERLNQLINQRLRTIERHQIDIKSNEQYIKKYKQELAELMSEG